MRQLFSVYVTGETNLLGKTVSPRRNGFCLKYILKPGRSDICVRQIASQTNRQLGKQFRIQLVQGKPFRIGETVLPKRSISPVTYRTSHRLGEKNHALIKKMKKKIQKVSQGQLKKDLKGNIYLSWDAAIEKNAFYN